MKTLTALYLGAATAVGVAFIGFLVMLFSAMVESQMQWQAWADEHCTKIGQVSDTVTYTLAPNANGATSFIPSITPGKRGYQCDDGVTYWR